MVQNGPAKIANPYNFLKYPGAPAMPCGILARMSASIPSESVFDDDILSEQEEEFALCIVACGGNDAKAYTLTFGPHAHAYPLAQELMRIPRIARRISGLRKTEETTKALLLGEHVYWLAQLRDDAKDAGQIKHAIQAEIARGNALGLQTPAQQAPKDGGGLRILINMNGQTMSVEQHRANVIPADQPLQIENNG